MTATGRFYWPREEHHLVINYNDEIVVSWWSNFAEQLKIVCAEGKDFNLTDTWTTRLVVPQNGTQKWSPIALSRVYDDWSVPVGCTLILRSDADGAMTGAIIGVTSVATQSASIFAQSTTMPYDSAISSATPTSSSASAAPTTSETPPPSFTPAPATSASSSLSTGAKAGIGVGVAVGVLLIAMFAFLFYRNHRKVKNLENRMTYQAQPPIQPPMHSPQPYYPQMRENYKPPDMVSDHQGDTGYQRPWSGAETWSHSQTSPLPPPQELSTASR